MYVCCCKYISCEYAEGSYFIDMPVSYDKLSSTSIFATIFFKNKYVIRIHILCSAGLMPYNYLTVQAGEILGSLTSVNELIKVDTLIKIAVMACVALVPGLYLRSVDAYTET